MKESALKELYVDELKDLYSAEKQLVKALPKVAKAVTAPKLKARSRSLAVRLWLGKASMNLWRAARLLISNTAWQHAMALPS